jgi:ribonuclease HI
MEDVLMSEALAIKDGLISANATGLVNIEVESDSLSVIKLMNNPLADRLTLAGICHEVYELSNSLSFCSIRHIRREANGAAHSTALNLHLRGILIGGA